MFLFFLNCLMFENTPLFSGITRYKCHHCGLEWDKFNDLRRHIKSMHILKRFKYKCYYCSFRGSLLIHLKKHTTEKHLGAKLLCCPYCYYQTYLPYCLRYHVINKHLKGNCKCFSYSWFIIFIMKNIVVSQYIL